MTKREPNTPDADDALLEPTSLADAGNVIEKYFPEAVSSRFEIHSYRNAASILSENHREIFDELLVMLDHFSINTTLIREPGGNESRIVKLVSSSLRGRNWHETSISGDLSISLNWKESGKKFSKEFIRKGYIDGHKIDYVKGRIAFDMEWNSKDQTYDRDLYAFRAFYEAGAIDAGVIFTRVNSIDMNFLKSLGPALDKNHNETSSQTFSKFGASTTWLGKLIYRIEAGRGGGCPILAIGITPQCVIDYKEFLEARSS